MTDALSKLLIAEGIITDEEFRTQLQTELANYIARGEAAALKRGQHD